MSPQTPILKQIVRINLPTSNVSLSPMHKQALINNTAHFTPTDEKSISTPSISTPSPQSNSKIVILKNAAKSTIKRTSTSNNEPEIAAASNNNSSEVASDETNKPASRKRAKQQNVIVKPNKVKAINILGEFFEEVVNRGTFNVADHLDLRLQNDNNNNNSDKSANNDNDGLSNTFIRCQYEKNNTDRVVEALNNINGNIAVLANAVLSLNNKLDMNNNRFNSSFGESFTLSSPLVQSSNDISPSQVPPSAQQPPSGANNTGELGELAVVEPEINYLNDKQLFDIFESRASDINFAVRIFKQIFTKNEMIGRNVNGKTFHNNQQKEPLDPKRISYIRKVIKRFVKTDGLEKEATFWSECVIAINKYVLQVNDAQRKPKKTAKRQLIENKENDDPNAVENEIIDLL